MLHFTKFLTSLSLHIHGMFVNRFSKSSGDCTMYSVTCEWQLEPSIFQFLGDINLLYYVTHITVTFRFFLFSYGHNLMFVRDSKLVNYLLSWQIFCFIYLYIFCYYRNTWYDTDGWKRSFIFVLLSVSLLKYIICILKSIFIVVLHMAVLNI